MGHQSPPSHPAPEDRVLDIPSTDLENLICSAAERWIMQHTEHRMIRPMCKVQKKLKTVLGSTGIQTGKWFIREENRRIPNQSPDQGETVTLSSGEGRGIPLERNISIAHSLEQLGGLLPIPALFSGDSQPVWELQISLKIAFENRGILAHQRDSGSPFRHSTPGILFAHQTSSSLGGGVEAGDLSKQGALATARGSLQKSEAFLSKFESEILEQDSPFGVTPTQRSTKKEPTHPRSLVQFHA